MTEDCQRQMTEEEIKCKALRNEVRDLAAKVILLKADYQGREDEFSGQTAEMIANVMLAYRHLEDARMRIGKVMQQLQGGVSIFDR